MFGGFFVHPIFLFPRHAVSSRYFACRAGAIRWAGLRPVAESLDAVFPYVGLPLIQRDLDRHAATPDAGSARRLIRAWVEPAVAPSAINFQRRGHAQPGRSPTWRCRSSRNDFEGACLVELDRFHTAIGNRNREPANGIPRSECVLRLRPRADAHRKVPRRAIQHSPEKQRKSGIGVVALVERAHEPDPRLNRHHLPRPGQLGNRGRTTFLGFAVFWSHGWSVGTR